ncbi:TetR/AcrR family transcriptional regulator [Maribacter polysaccharolyticus]|uniref:TetR/AcrR family transcriptional regulator n=1 Tax=Maribacter polysaccharolyticus TaxID=3020831 RepID=UPI00237F65CA|nr:TetR/AcrR family transcriptional regulator [Maribacter polysaccharolyticus]MDE3743262.1 TetR/AcrR family transcriptional regulator [Maribacter polysaccharolyticus]
MKHSEIKNRIIETASSLFYKNGYNSTGINEIISQAGIAKATLYSHFKSKEDICIAYLRFKDASFIKDIEAFVTSKPKGKAQILAIFDFLELFFQTKDFNGCWCIKTVSEIPSDNEVIRNEIQKQKNSFIQLISKLIANNLEEIKTEEISSLSRKIYLLYESAVSESHLHQKKWPIQETKNLCSSLIT